MDNLSPTEANIGFNSDALICVGAYGFNITIAYQVVFTEGLSVYLVIKKPEGSPITALIEPSNIDFDESTLVYTVQEGDFDEDGTFYLQLVQIGEDKKMFSPIFRVPVNESLSDLIDI